MAGWRSNQRTAVLAGTGRSPKPSAQRPMRRTALFHALSLLVLLFALSGAAAPAAADAAAAAAAAKDSVLRPGEERGLMFSNSQDDGTGPVLISIEPFVVRYGPTPSTATDGESIQLVIEKSIESYVLSVTQGLEYLLLTNIQEVVWYNGPVRRLQDTEPTPVTSLGTTAVDFRGGIASFENGAPPYTAAELNEWIRQAVDSQQFVDALNALPEYGAIAQTAYIPEVAPTPSPTTAAPTRSPIADVAGVARDTYPTDNDSGPSFGWIALAGGLAVCAFVVVGSVLYIKSKPSPRNSLEKVDEPIEIDDANTDIEDMTDDGTSGQQAVNNADEAESAVAQYERRQESVESASVTSSWTMEDSLATANTAQRMQNDLWMASEAFNRESQLVLSKDMMHSMWNIGYNQTTGAATDLAALASAAAVSAPVHPNEPAGRRQSRLRRNSGSTRPFVFEQANSSGNEEGKEIFLMPSSPAHGSIQLAGREEI